MVHPTCGQSCPKCSVRKDDTMNIFAELLHSVYDFKSYTGFRKNGTGKVLLYGLLLSAIYFVISFVLPVMVTIVGFGGFSNLAKETIPDFRLEDGRLWVEKTYDIQEYDTYQGGIYLKVDTSRSITEEITDVDLLPFDRVLIMDAEHMIVKNEGSAVIRISYDDLDFGNMTRDEFLKEIGAFLPIFLWIMMVVVVCVSLLGFFGGALVIAVIGSIMSAVMGCGLKFGEIYKLAIYSRTPAFLVDSVYSWLPFTIGYFYVINYGISVFYLWKAFRYIREEEMGYPKNNWT